MSIRNHQLDVLIIGAGLSGIGAACHLVREETNKSFAILERRDAIGGTWDLFKYPGVRSDSDMLTFGFGFRPWNGTKVLADGPSIKGYIEETAAEYGVTSRIRFGRRVTSISWSSDEGQWTVRAQAGGDTEVYTARFLIGATGYYDYDAGHRPEFPGEQDFRGQIIHPQFWPEGLDYRGKRVVVIGSGATAITLVPAMAGDAGHVTMLQRSPTYILPVPGADPLATPLARAGLPTGPLYKPGRLRNILIQQSMYKFCRKNPALARRVIAGITRARVGRDIDMKHFTPSYNPWDERLCVVPDGDFFATLRRGEASVVTDHIETFTETGLRTRSGEEIPADIIVTATGLRIQMLGGADVSVDGEKVSTRDALMYKGVLMEGVPNAMFVIGYTNASWTLKADLASEYFCRLLKHMEAEGHDQVVAVAGAGDRDDVSVLGASMRSGYIQRGDAAMPRQGKRMPWQLRNDYYKDARVLRREPVDDPALRFRSSGSAGSGSETVAEAAPTSTAVA
ncbi:MAG: NAD(P)/FAD-dependent oxidoreductase [Streptosporangiales bacterium]|nr:NAD(P)/FAD-dependent oxidoreductase [Streptosporangiales bacterium]